MTTGFWLTRAGKDIHILEKADRVGGQIHTFREKDFVYESGPNTGVVSYPEVAELFEALSPACALETAREESKRRLIWKGKPVPGSPVPDCSVRSRLLCSRLATSSVSSESRFRAKGNNPDESVGELAARRLGKSFLHYAVDPVSVRCLRRRSDETRHSLCAPEALQLGTAIRELHPRNHRESQAAENRSRPSRQQESISAAGGLDKLTGAMAEAIGPARITLSAADVTVRPCADKWMVTYSTADGEQTIIAERIITTTGAYTLPALLPFVPKEKMERISNLHYAPVVQASVGFRDTGALRFDAFGGLVPSCEKKDVLGILFPSACFTGRAPEEGALFSFFIGGVKHADLTTWPEEELKALIRRELHTMLKFPEETEPDMIRIFRHEHAIPQYEQSSGSRFETIDELQARYPGLTLAGNIKGGIGMADRIRQATEIADKLING